MLRSHVALKGIGRTSLNKILQNKMATMQLEDHILLQNLETISPTDLEVLDIFNFPAANTGNGFLSSSQEMELGRECQPVVQKSNLDQRLFEATMTVLKTGKRTPLIKEELKCAIQIRRLARGEDELTVDLSPPPPRPLSPEEAATIGEKLKVRRERNRVAALKCRRKKRSEKQSIKEQSEKLQAKNDTLREQLEEMGREKEAILKVMREVHGVQLNVGGISPSWVGGASPYHEQVGVSSFPNSPVNADQLDVDRPVTPLDFSSFYSFSLSP